MSFGLKKLLKFIIKILVLLLLGGLVYFYRAPLATWLAPYSNRFFTNLNYRLEELVPCQQPITLSLGEVDPQFKLSEMQLTTAINQANEIWSQPFGKPLFNLVATSGSVVINLVYDNRQETTDKLKKLGIVVGNDQQAYEQLKAKYDALNQQYQAQKTALKGLIANYDARQADYNSEVNKWNKKGGAPDNIFEQLAKTKSALESQLAAVNEQTNQVNLLVQDLNTEGTALNRLISELNLNVNKYNTVGGAVGSEFEEGVYIQDEAGRRINVYEFSDSKQLVRLLAHEFGHALNLDHSSGTIDIMYYLNEAGNDTLTANDLAALQKHCKVNK